MGIAQSKQGSITTAGFPVTLTITLDSATTSGNSLIVLVAASGFSSNPTAIACTLGGVTGNFVQDSTFGSSADAAIGATWRDQPCAGGQTSVAITATGGAGVSAITATVYECDDLAASPFDKNANSVNGASGTWTSTATATTTQAAERLFGAVFATGTAQTITGPSSPWVNLAQVSQVQSTFTDEWMAGSQDVAATGTYTYNGTVTSTPAWIANIVTYKLLAGATAGGPMPAQRHNRRQRAGRRRQAQFPAQPPPSAPSALPGILQFPVTVPDSASW